MRRIARNEISDIIVGATFLGAGGGGSPKTGQLLLDQIDSVNVVDLDEVPDGANVCVVAGMGSPAVLREIGWKGEEILALEKFEEITGKKIDFLVPVEIGAFNSITPLHAGSVKKLPVVDADGAGRAVPELQMTTFQLYGISASPVVLADRTGNTAVLYAKDTHTAEKLARAITTEFGMQAGIACYAMTGQQLKQAAVPNTLSLAEKVGRTIRNSRLSGSNVIEAVVGITGGKTITVGKVAKKTTETRSGFDYGRIYLEDVVVDYKNENMIVWKGNYPVAMVPDLICWITTNGEPLTNADIEEGMEVALIVIKAHQKWHTKNGFELFKSVLCSLGYHGDYLSLSIG